jgi:hypothetical protein
MMEGVEEIIEFHTSIGEIDDCLLDEVYDPPPVVKQSKIPDKDKSNNLIKGELWQN